MSLKETMDILYRLADPAIVEKKAKKWGVQTEKSLGIHHKELKEVARKIGTNDGLARELIDTEIYEARLLASKIMDPQYVTEAEMDEWVLFFDTWEMCDSYCMAVFARSGFAKKKIDDWYMREEEFVRRAAFAVLAAYTMAEKKADNEVFTQYFRHIREASSDARIYVKKAVNWALRSIGKRNIDLKHEALGLSYELLKTDHKAAQWIAKDAIRELEKPDVRMSNYPRSVYG